jgi:hypothetical protein
MKLLVVSHTEHYLKNGTVVGWGPTVREIDHLANLFDEIIHIAMLHTGPAPDSAIAYQSPRVKLCPVPAAGGSGLKSKLRIAAIIPGFICKFSRVNGGYRPCPMSRQQADGLCAGAQKESTS